MLISFGAIAQEYIVSIKNTVELVPGQEVEAIISRVDGRERVEYFEGQILADVLYVLEDKKEKTLFLVKSQSSQTKKKDLNRFEIQGAEFKDKKIETNFTLFPNKYEYSNKKSRRNIFFITLAILIFMIIIIKLKNKHSKKKRIKSQREKLLAIIIGAQSREDFEKIYILKEQVKDSLEYNKKHFETFCTVLNSIQYKAQWNQEEKKKIKEIHDKLIRNIEVLDGL